MASNQDFNPQKDINRYLSQQGRQPQSHLDWDMWRKVGQPGTYQAPPGTASRFQGVSSGAGSPNYGPTQESNYNMFANTGNAMANAIGTIGGYLASNSDRGGNGKIGRKSSSSSGSDTDMSDTGAPGVSGTGRSQVASITSPSTSRGMRRGGRGNNFQSTLAQHGIQMVQGNDNYGTVYGNMGGANVGSGNYDNSFRSNTFNGPTSAPPAPPAGGSSPPPPFFAPPTGGPNPPPPPAGGGTPTSPPPAPPAGGGATAKPQPQRPQIGVGSPTSPAPVTGTTPQPIGQGPSTYGNTEGLEQTQTPVAGPSAGSLARGEKIYGLATRGATPGERMNAQDKWHGMGYQGPFRPEETPQQTPAQTPTAAGPAMLPSAKVGQPQAPTAGPTLQTAPTDQPQAPAPPAQSMQAPKMRMGPNGAVTEEKYNVDMHRQAQGLPYSPGFAADYSGLDYNKISPEARRLLPGASTIGVNEQGGVGNQPYGPEKAAKKSGGRKPAAAKATSKTVEGPKSVASKKASSTKAPAKGKGKK